VSLPSPAPAPIARADWRRQELHREWRELERARERFYATWDGSPWSRRRFERWYDARRVELERRWAPASERRGWDRDRD
jgi:hypothetical protein